MPISPYAAMSSLPIQASPTTFLRHQDLSINRTMDATEAYGDEEVGADLIPEEAIDEEFWCCRSSRSQ